MTALILCECDGVDDWYTIERREHENKSEIRHIPEWGCMGLFYSGRISDCDVEGTAEEMLSIAKAIEERGSFSAKRCAVSIDGDKAAFHSPRNSMRDGVVSLADADALAAEIRAKLAP